jgi:hypothetical protein
MGLLLVDVVLTKQTIELVTVLIEFAAALVPCLLLLPIRRDKVRFEIRTARAQETWIRPRFFEAPRASAYKPTERKGQQLSVEKKRRRHRRSKRPKGKR